MAAPTAFQAFTAARQAAAERKREQARQRLQQPGTTVHGVAAELGMDYHAACRIARELVAQGLREAPRTTPVVKAPSAPVEWLDLPSARIRAAREANGLNPLTGDPM